MGDVFRIQGEVDLATAAALGEALRAHAAASPGDVVCDCSGMSFIDSSGIKVLVSLARQLRADERRLSLTNVRPNCRLVMDVTGLGNLIELEPTGDDLDDEDSGEIDVVGDPV